MDTPPRRGLDRFRAAVDVLEASAGKAADHGIFAALGDLVDAGEIAFGGDREAGLDHVDAHCVEHLRDFELFLMRHGGAGALLAIAQCRVEDEDVVVLGSGCWFGGRLGWAAGAGFHARSLSFAPVSDSSSGIPVWVCWALGWLSWVSWRSPECPGATAQPALRGQ